MMRSQIKRRKPQHAGNKILTQGKEVLSLIATNQNTKTMSGSTVINTRVQVEGADVMCQVLYAELTGGLLKRVNKKQYGN